ncbi:MAG: 2-oxoglutarate dehydrogenase complex dihydrolipoyllysine-residue succinyltransferase [Gemmataceae bacterium]|nr:2-oxoglutarate dehydrogenase complex dihydrolipoyllysine-residue succinyltransferase [Gemmataceae bacterium]
MAVPISVPSVGESITEGSIARWMKKDGDLVRTDEPIFELETEKASNEVPSPSSGRLTISVKEGSRVTIGQVVGSIEPADVPAATKTPAPAAPTTPPKAEPTPKTDHAMSPAARAIVAEKGIDPASIAGSGRHGVLTKPDVLEHLEKNNAVKDGSVAPPPVPQGQVVPLDQRETRQRMSSIRARIAQRLLQSQQTTASLTTFNEADMSAISELRAKYKDKFKEKHGVNLGFMSFFVKAAVEALKAFPVVNARIDGDDLVFCHYWNIGVAVSTEKGLMVPVLRDADKLSFADIEKAIGGLAVKARDGKIGVADLQGGTFTITNGGIFGSMMSTPILNPPQSAILGMHSITKRAVVKDDQIVIRPMMYLAVTYDHRVIDGREAVQFLVRIKECLENPERLLLEI